MVHIRLVVLFFLLSISFASAQELKVSGMTNSGPVDTLGGQLPAPDTEIYDVSAASGPLQDQAGVSFGGCCGATNSHTKAQADFGWLQAQTRAFVTGLNGPPYVGGLVSWAQAEASYVDTLTFHQPSGQVGTGSATLVLDIYASLLASDGGANNEFAPQGAEAKFLVRFTRLDNGVEFEELLEKEGRVATHFLDLSNQIPPPDSLGRFEIDIDFLFEVPVELKLYVYLYAYADGGLDPLEPTSSAFSGFSQVRWMGASEVRQFNGNPIVPDISSGSGANYEGPIDEPPVFESGFESSETPD